MKKIALFVLFLLVIMCSAFADVRTVIINGEVPQGYIPDDDNPIGYGGLKIIPAVKTLNTEKVGEISSMPTDFLSLEEAENETIEDVDLVQNLADGNAIKSLYIAYGAYGNIKGDEYPAFTIKAESLGWKLNKEEPAVDTLELTANSTPKGSSNEIDKLFYGTQGTGENTILVQTNPGFTNDSRIVSKDAPILVGYTAVEWGVAEGKTPAAGSYTGTIKLTFTGE